MNRILTCLLLTSIVAQPTSTESTANAADAGGSAAVAISVLGVDVRASVTENGGGVALSAGGKESVAVELPPSESETDHGDTALFSGVVNSD